MGPAGGASSLELNVGGGGARARRAALGAELARPGARGQGLAPRKAGTNADAAATALSDAFTPAKPLRQSPRLAAQAEAQAETPSTPRSAKKGSGKASKIKTPKHRITEVWGR